LCAWHASRISSSTVTLASSRVLDISAAPSPAPRGLYVNDCGWGPKTSCWGACKCVDSGAARADADHSLTVLVTPAHHNSLAVRSAAPTNLDSDIHKSQSLERPILGDNMVHEQPYWRESSVIAAEFDLQQSQPRHPILQSMCGSRPSCI
jgi:hypothetical protein